MVTLRELRDAESRAVLGLRVRPDQERFVASNQASLAFAAAAPNAWVRAIYVDDRAVGLVVVEDDPARPLLRRFMIDASFQRRGYGAAALALVVGEIAGRRPGCRELWLRYRTGDGNPAPFYARFGFEEAGEDAQGRRLMRLLLPPIRAHANAF